MSHAIEQIYNSTKIMFIFLFRVAVSVDCAWNDVCKRKHFFLNFAWKKKLKIGTMTECEKCVHEMNKTHKFQCILADNYCMLVIIRNAFRGKH